jgi:hypothetical protein
MSALTIRRLAADVPADDDTQASLARVDRLLRLVADGALEERSATYEALSGEWYVRRLELDLDLAVDEPDASAATRWAGTIAGAVGELVADGTNVLHFRSRGRLLLDLVVGLAAGDLSRAWAWRLAALLTPTDPDPADGPSAALVAALGREPTLALPVLARAAQQVGVPALHATLGPGGWSELADRVVPEWRVALPGAAPALDARPGLEHRAAAVLADSAFARAVRAGGVVPDAPTLSAWAALVLAESDPAGPVDMLPWIAVGLAHPHARQPTLQGFAPPAEGAAAELDRSVTPIRRNLDEEPPRPRQDLDLDVGGRVPDGSSRAGESRVTPQPRSDIPATSARPTDAVARMDADAASPSPTSTDDPGADQATTPPDPEPGAPTDWAGLLFLLNAAAAAGLPGVLETDAKLAARPLHWSLHQLALRLVPIRADDPAALGLAGLPPEAPVPAGAPATPAEEAALDQHAAGWAEAVMRALRQARRPDDDTRIPTLWLLARRPGVIVADPGWLEVRLNIEDVDLMVRRAGLDLDPGWLDWLGTVVVFRYG